MPTLSPPRIYQIIIRVYGKHGKLLETSAVPLRAKRPLETGFRPLQPAAYAPIFPEENIALELPDPAARDAGHAADQRDALELPGETPAAPDVEHQRLRDQAGGVAADAPVLPLDRVAAGEHLARDVGRHRGWAGPGRADCGSKRGAERSFAPALEELKGSRALWAQINVEEDKIRGNGGTEIGSDSMRMSAFLCTLLLLGRGVMSRMTLFVFPLSSYEPIAFHLSEDIKHLLNDAECGVQMKEMLL